MAFIVILLVSAALALAVAVRMRSRGASQEPAGETEPVSAAPSSGPCSETDFEGVRYIVCTAEPARHSIALHLKDADGKPYGSLEAFNAAAGGGTLFAMNAGMYHADLTPVGLHVENGIELSPLNLSSGAGNFFLKPNGVFGVSPDGAPFLVRTEIYALSKRPVAFATQSGPMLVIDGQIHPKFQPDGESRHIRNGVGVTEDGKAVFAITRDPVSLGKFARFFRDRAQCPDALFFDGAVSSLAVSGRMVIDSGFPAGPIVAVAERSEAAKQ